MVEPTSGSAYVLDRRAGRSREVRELIGLVPSGDRSFYLRLSGLENLVFFARMHGLRRRAARERAAELLDAVGLSESAERPVNTYSHGMQKRLSFARALLHGPSVLLVDEATHDLDPVAAEQVRGLTRDCARRGTAVVWATQRIEELAGFAERVTVLDRGAVCFAGTVAELAAAGGGDRHVVGLGPRTTAKLPALDAALGTRGRVQPASDAAHVLITLVSRRLPRRRAVRAHRGRRRGRELPRRAPADGAGFPRPHRGECGVSVLVAEARKVPAFLRRDFLTMLSYRVAFVGDLLAIAVQAVMFGFIAELVDPSALPVYNGVSTGYFEFVMIGVVIVTVSGLLLQKVSTAIREEQLMGTLEALLVTPTSTTTVQAGSAAFDLFFIPIRMAVLLLVVAVTFGLGFAPSGIVPSLVLLMCFVPFVWGLGLVTAAVIVTFRRGGGRDRLLHERPRPRFRSVLPAGVAAGMGPDDRRGQPGRDRHGGHARGPDRRGRLGRRRDCRGWSCSRCPPWRCSRAWPPSAPPSRASIGAGRWGSTDMWDRVDDLLGRRRTRRPCGSIASSCSRRGAAARTAWTSARWGRMRRRPRSATSR